MTDAKAIKLGVDIPKGFKEMARVKCGTCATEYIIVHDERFADPATAIRQADEHRIRVEGEHVDLKNIHLLDVYEPLD
jgi:hypothetical protein